MQLKLITYNIWHGTYLEKVINFLQTEKPDVLMLQEVGTVGLGFDGTVPVNMWEKIKTALGMEGEFRRMFWGPKPRGLYDMGVAVLSRYPIMAATDHLYERREEEISVEPGLIDRYFLPRKLLGLKLKVAGGLWFFNTHFTITPDARVTPRQLQSVAEIKGFLAKYPEYILGGDMNTPYKSETYNRLAEGLTDVSNGKEPTLHPRIHKVGNLKLHVDYLFYKSTRMTPVSTRIPIVDGSDHLPVVVEIKIE